LGEIPQNTHRNKKGVVYTEERERTNAYPAIINKSLLLLTSWNIQSTLPEDISLLTYTLGSLYL
jgi:hypothetical protein